MKKEQHLKALFSQRFVAFMIDLILVSFITSLVTAIIPTNSSIDKLYDQQVKIVENYTAGKITMQEYVNQLVDINYDIAKQTGIITLVSIAISLLYYVLYVYKNDDITQEVATNGIEVKDDTDEISLSSIEITDVDGRKLKGEDETKAKEKLSNRYIYKIEKH